MLCPNHGSRCGRFSVLKHFVFTWFSVFGDIFAHTRYQVYESQFSGGRSGGSSGGPPGGGPGGAYAPAPCVACSQQTPDHLLHPLPAPIIGEFALRAESNIQQSVGNRRYRTAACVENAVYVIGPPTGQQQLYVY